MDSFNYLSNIVDVLGGTEEDIQNRIHKARQAFSSLNKLWNTEQIGLSSKLRIFKSNVLLVQLRVGDMVFHQGFRKENNLC